MSQDIIGLKIQFEIEEDGTENPPQLPPGTIVQRLMGPDHSNYYLVKLDQSVKCLRASTGREWMLRELIITPHFEGESLERLASRLTKRPIFVGIANVLEPLHPDDPIFTLSQIEYFALGRVKCLL